jgi:hypothetical protein
LYYVSHKVYTIIIIIIIGFPRWEDNTPTDRKERALHLGRGPDSSSSEGYVYAETAVNLRVRKFSTGTRSNREMPLSATASNARRQTKAGGHSAPRPDQNSVLRVSA